MIQKCSYSVNELCIKWLGKFPLSKCPQTVSALGLYCTIGLIYITVSIAICYVSH